MATQRTPRQGSPEGTGGTGTARRRPPSEARKAAGAATAHRLRIVLSESDPPIWRDVEVSSDTRLDRLHRVIQAVMGWHDTHAHRFEVGDECIGDPESIEDARDETTLKLHQVAPEKGASFLYVYDLDDDWQHEVTVAAIEARPSGPAAAHCTGGARACPPEECGGIWGYEDFLQALRDPGDDEHEASFLLVGGRFNPEAFDAAVVNRRLRQLR